MSNILSRVNNRYLYTMSYHEVVEMLNDKSCCYGFTLEDYKGRPLLIKRVYDTNCIKTMYYGTSRVNKHIKKVMKLENCTCKFIGNNTIKVYSIDSKCVVIQK